MKNQKNLKNKHLEICGKDILQVKNKHVKKNISFIIPLYFCLA